VSGDESYVTLSIKAAGRSQEVESLPHPGLPPSPPPPSLPSSLSFTRTCKES
jgi:hypothetical protein